MRRDPKTGAPNFFRFARDFLHAYLPKTRGLSPKTIEAYRISLECYLSYLAETKRIERDRVSFDHFDRQHLKGWITWMADQRHYATKTVTLRLSAVKAFLAYASCEDLTLVALSQAAKALKAPAHPRTPIEYLDEPETRAILAAFAGSTTKSRRNRMLLILLYDTAARVGEITGLTLGDLSLTDPAHVTLTGKGEQDPHCAAHREDHRPSARLSRRVPSERRETPRDTAVVLQPAPRTTYRTVSRHGLSSAQTSCQDCTRTMPFDTRSHPLPHAAQDQGHGPLPAGHPAAAHYAPPRP